MNRRNYLNQLCASFMLASSFTCTSLLPVVADTLPSLQSEQPALDQTATDGQTAKDAPPQAPDAAPSEKHVLNGRVSRINKHSDEQTGSQDGDTATVQPQSAGGLSVPLDSLKAQDMADLMKAMSSPHVLKLLINGKQPMFFNFGSRKPKMSTEEFRKLEYGVIGIDALARLDTAGPVVTSIYPTCPAALNGMKVGDQLVSANGHVFKAGEGQRVLWQIVGGRAGTPVDVTVLRDGQLITFHLIRMNIEDVQDDTIRRTYELLLDTLGPPQNDI